MKKDKFADVRSGMTSLVIVAMLVLQLNLMTDRTSADPIGPGNVPPPDPPKIPSDPDYEGPGAILDSGDGEWDPPVANTTDPNPDVNILQVNASQEAIAPELVNETLDNLTKPDPNFVVQNVNTGWFVVKAGTVVIVNATVNNTGYLPVRYSNVSFYDGPPSPSTRFATALAAFDGLLAKVSAPWIASGNGVHTLYAVADPYNYTRELNETDNSNSTSITVVSYTVGTPPNLVPNTDASRPQGIPVLNVATTVDIVVSNVGGTMARNITVIVYDSSVGQIIDNYLIGSLGTTANNQHATGWMPSVSGLVSIRVTVDAFNNETEGNEFDNDAELLLFVSDVTPIPIPTLCTGKNEVHTNEYIVRYGDVTVPSGRTCTFQNSQVMIFGNVRIYGRMNLRTSRLILATSTPGTTRFLDTYSGGYLEVTTSIISALYSSPSIFSSVSYLGFVFRAYYGSSLYVTGSFIYSTTLDSRTGKSGVQIETGVSAVSTTTVAFGRQDGISCSAASSSTFSANTIQRNVRTGIYLYPNCARVIQGGLVQLNEIGIRADWSSMIDEVTIQFNRDTGVLVTQASPVISESTILDNGKFGIKVEGLSSPLITNNIQIKTAGQIGVGIYGVTSTAPTVGYTQKIEDSRIGAYVEGTRAQIIANTFEDNIAGLVGVGTNLVADGNHFTLPNSNTPGELKVGYSEHERPAFPGQGILETPSDTDILGNDFHGHGDRECTGIWIEKSSGTVVARNELDPFLDNNHPSWAMVALSSTGLNISVNRFNDYTRAIYLKSVAGTLWKNSLHLRDRHPDIQVPVATGGYGIRVEASSVSITPPTVYTFASLLILANWINFTGSSIYLIGSSPWIEWNKIVFDYYRPGHKYRYYDDPRGIYQDIGGRAAFSVYHGSSPMIRQSYIEGNSYGISLESRGTPDTQCNPIIEYNTIVLNGYVAIGTGERDSDIGFLYDLNSPTIRHNTITRSSGAAINIQSRGAVDIHDNAIEQTNGVTLLCLEVSCATWNTVYWGAIMIQVPYIIPDWVPLPPPGSLNIHANTIQTGNRSGIWVARGVNEHEPYTSLDIYSNPAINGFTWGVIDEGRRGDGEEGMMHRIRGNTIGNNEEGIQVKGNGMPAIYGNEIFGASLDETKGIAFYGYRNHANAFTYNQENSIHDVDMGFFVYDTTYDESGSGKVVTLTISADDDVSASNYGILSKTDTDDCSDALDKGSAFDIVDSYFTGMAVAGIYTRCASPQIMVDADPLTRFDGNHHGGFIIGNAAARSGLYPSVNHGSFSTNDETGLHVQSTTIFVSDSEFRSQRTGVVAPASLTGPVIFVEFSNNIVTDNNYVVGGEDKGSGMWLGEGTSGTIGDPQNWIERNGQGIYAYMTSVTVTGNQFEDNGLAIHVLGNSLPAIIGNDVTGTATNPCDAATRRDGIYAKDVNPQSAYQHLTVESNIISFACYGIHIVNSGMGGGTGYQGWVYLSDNDVLDGSGEGGLWVQGSKVVSNPGSIVGEGDRIGDQNHGHRARLAVRLDAVVSFEAYRMEVKVHGCYLGSCWNPNAVTVSGTAYFEDSILEALTAELVGGGGLIQGTGGEQTFVRTEVNQLYTHHGVVAMGGAMTFRDSWIPKVGFQSPNVGVFVLSWASVTLEHTRVRGEYAAIHTGYVGWGPGEDLTVTGNANGGSDIQATYVGIWLYSYSGDVLIEESTIHDSQTGILHADSDGTAEIRDNAIQANLVGISIMGGAPHIYGDAGAGNGNVITGNTQYGIYIAATADADCSDLVCVKVEWNDIYGNFGNGIEAADPGGGNYFYGKCNWWGHTNGPDDDSAGLPDQSNNDPGQDVSDNFFYRDQTPPPPPQPQLWWLHESSQTATTCAP